MEDSVLKQLEYSFYYQSFEVKLIKCLLCLASLLIASFTLRNSIATLRKRTSSRTSTAYKIMLFSASLIHFSLVVITNAYSFGKAFFMRPEHPGYDDFNIVFLTILQVCSTCSNIIAIWFEWYYPALVYVCHVDTISKAPGHSFTVFRQFVSGMQH